MRAAIDIQARLNQLNTTVKAGQAIKQAQKRDDWSRVVTEHPEHADHITEISKVFGKPERVQVRTPEAILLDSVRYK